MTKKKHKSRAKPKKKRKTRTTKSRRKARKGKPLTASERRRRARRARALQPREQLQMFDTATAEREAIGMPAPVFQLEPPMDEQIEPPPLGKQLGMFEHLVTPESVGSGYRGVCACGWTSEACATVNGVGDVAGEHLRKAYTVATA